MYPTNIFFDQDKEMFVLGKVSFLFRGDGGGWAGASEGRVISKFLQIGEGLTCFIRNWGRVTVFCCKEKIILVASLTIIC